jgi:hypothetical protein
MERRGGLPCFAQVKEEPSSVKTAAGDTEQSRAGRPGAGAQKAEADFCGDQRTKRTQCPCDPRCAQPVRRFSSTEKNSYITMAMAPTTTRPAKARPICMLLPAETSR